MEYETSTQRHIESNSNYRIDEIPTKFTSLIPDAERKYYALQVKPGNTPLWEYWTQFVMDWFFEGKSERSLLATRDSLRFLMRKCEIYSIETCNSVQTLGFSLKIKSIERRWSSMTFNSYRKRINSYFIWLEDLDIIEENKVKKIRTRKEPLKEQPTLNENQARIVLSKTLTSGKTRLQRTRNTFFIGLLLQTGIRPVEAENIKLDDLHRNGESFTIIIKGRKQKGRVRRYTIQGWLLDHLQSYLKERTRLNRTEEHLFVSLSKKETGLTYKGINALFKKLSKELGFPVSAYRIRRYVATSLERNGADIYDIMSHLGHTRISTTRRYIESSASQTKRGVNILSELLT